jgi:diacylglycerol kinase family enzyme
VGVAGLWLRMMTSSLGRAAGVGHERVTRVHLESTGEVPFQLDGEPAGMLPAEVRIEPGAVRLLMTWPGGRRITRQVAGYAE